MKEEVQSPSVLLSIIVPVYNVEQYLAECLDSVYGIDSISYEVILVNDGSIDSSDKIIARYANQFADITKIVEKPNGGLSSARNAGFKVAVGKYILFVDSDDYIDPVAVTSMAVQAEKDQLDVAVGNFISFWNERGNSERVIDQPEAVLSMPIANGKQYLKALFENNYRKPNCWTKMVKRQLLINEDIHFIEGMLYEDVPWTFQLMVVADRVKAVSERIYYYRRRPNSIMTAPVNPKELSYLTVAQNVMNISLEHFKGVKVFNNYIVYRYWLHTVNTGKRDAKLIAKLLFSLNLSAKERIRCVVILLGISKFFRDRL